MEDLQIFSNSEFGEIRTITKDNEPMFCLADVCKALELEQVSRVKARLKTDGVTTSKVTDRLGREQEATFINESNLYKTIFQSRKESAKHVLLLQIRSLFMEKRIREELFNLGIHSNRKGYAYIVDIMSNLDSALAIDGEIKKVAEKYGKSKDSIGSAVRNAVKTANHSLEVWKNYDCLTTKGFLTTMYYRTREESANE